MINFLNTFSSFALFFTNTELYSFLKFDHQSKSSGAESAALVFEESCSQKCLVAIGSRSLVQVQIAQQSSGPTVMRTLALLPYEYSLHYWLSRFEESEEFTIKSNIDLPPSEEPTACASSIFYNQYAFLDNKLLLQDNIQDGKDSFSWHF